MAGAGREYELLFKLKASLGGNFNSTFKSAIETQKNLQNSIKGVNSLQAKIDGYTKTSTAIEGQKTKLESLRQQHEQTAQKIQQHQKNAETLRKKIEETGDATGALTAQLVKEENEVEKNTEKLRRNESQTKQTTAAIERQEQRLEDVGRELREAGVDTENLEGANERLKRSYDDLKSVQNAIRDIDQRQQQVGASISKTKGELAKTVGVAGAVAAAFCAGPVTVYKDFQAEMSTVAGITGATGDELKALEKAAQDAGMTTWATATESAQALEYMSLAGWSSQESISNLNNMLKIAKITGLGLGASTDLVTDSMSAMGVNVKDLSHYLDVCTKANNVANTTANDLMEAILGCGGAAKTNGISLESLSTALSVFANNGLKGSEAGTAMNSILVRLTSNEKSLSMSAKLGVDIFDKQTGAFRGMGNVLKDMQNAMKDMSHEERDATLKAIAGTNYYSQFAYLLDSVSEGAKGTAGSWDVLTDKLNNAEGATDAMYETMMGNLKGALTEAGSAIEAVQLQLGKALVPTIEKAVRTVTPMIQSAAQWISENQELVAVIAKVAVGLTAFRIGTLSVKLAALTARKSVLTVARGILQMRANMLTGAKAASGFAARLKSAGSIAGTSFKALRGVLGGVMKTGIKALGPIGGMAVKFMPLIGIITAVVTVFNLLKNHMEEIRGVVGKVFGESGLQVFDGVIEKVTKIGSAMKEAFTSGDFGALREQIGEIFGAQGTAIFDEFAESFRMTVETIKVVAPLLLPVFQAVFSSIGTIVITLMNVYQGLLDFITGVFTGNWTQAWEGVKSIFSSILDGLGATAKTVLNTIIGYINSGISSINGIKIPDWVPIVGGKNANIPLIPTFAKGTRRTPDTFIAGEEGPELITNAPGRVVYTAQQTRAFMGLQKTVAATAGPTFGAGPQKIQPPQVISTAGQGGKAYNLTINNNPTIITNGGDAEELEEKLEENNKKLLQDVEDLLDKRDDDERRSRYE